MKYKIIFERGDIYEVEATSMGQAWLKVIEEHPETCCWDLRDILEETDSNYKNVIVD